MTHAGNATDKQDMIREMREARAFATEAKLVLVLEAKRQLRQARRGGDPSHVREMQALIQTLKAQGKAMRRLRDPVAIRACADEWQKVIGYLDLVGYSI